MQFTQLEALLSANGDIARQLREFLRHPISKLSVEFAEQHLGVRPATKLYRELVERFLVERPAQKSHRMDARTFRRALPGTGLPKDLFLKERQTPDFFLSPRVDYWHDRADDACSILGAPESAIALKWYATFVGFFCLHEQIFWAICGVADFVTRDATDVWELKTASHNAAFTRWFSGFLDNEAESALRLKLLIDVGLHPFEKAPGRSFPKRITGEMLEHASTKILDRCYSLNGRFLIEPPENWDESQARGIAKWLCMLIVWDHLSDGKFLDITGETIERLGLSRCHLELMLVESRKNDGLDMVIESEDIDSVRTRPEMSIGHLTSVMRQVVIPRDIIKNIGNWFEQSYLVQYLTDDVPSEWYRVFRGFKADQNDNVQGYDVDFIIEDMRRDLLFFIQVKYHYKSYLPYLFDECDTFFMKKDGIVKGVRQLRSLDGQFGDNVVLDKISGALGRRVTAQELETKVRFILLHNLNTFDIGQIGNVAAYNWNIFRNFLKGGFGHIALDKTTIDSDAVTVENPLPLEDAFATANAISNVLGGKEQTQRSWKLYSAVRVVMSSPLSGSPSVSLCLH